MNNSLGTSGQGPNNNDWGNPNNFNDGYNNRPRPARNSEAAVKIVNSCNKLAKAYISLFFIFIFCVILVIVFTALSVQSAYSSYYNYDYGYTSNVDTTQGMLTAVTVMTVFLVIFVIAVEVIGIILIVKTSALKEFYPETGSLWILFLIGLFVGITSLIGAFMTLSSSKRIIKNNSNNTYQDYAQDQPTKY